MEQDWIEVFRTNQEYQAVIAKDILENHGLKVVVMNQHDSTYLSFGSISVMVAEADSDLAVNLLADLKH